MDDMYVEEMENLAILYFNLNLTIVFAISEVMKSSSCIIRLPRRVYKRVRQDDHYSNLVLY